MAYEGTSNAAGVTPQVIVGLFNDAGDAHHAITQLKESGFNSSRIGAAFRDASTVTNVNRGEMASDASEEVRQDGESWWEKVKDAFRSDDRPEDEASLHSAAEARPYARDEYEYEFAGDDFERSLSGTGIPADRAAYLTRNLRAGGAVITVSDVDRAAEAEQIISANHGTVRYEDVAGAGVAATQFPQTDLVDRNAAPIDAADSTGREITDTGYTDRRPEDVENRAVDRVQLFGEVLRVHKERISRGEVRLRKEVITENQTIEVPVTREELVLERVAVPANTPAPSANIGHDQEIRIPLSQETVRVERVPVVTGEVLVGKRSVGDVARVEDSVRHEELRVDSDVEAPGKTVEGEKVADDLLHRG